MLKEVRAIARKGKGNANSDPLTHIYYIVSIEVAPLKKGYRFRV